MLSVSKLCVSYGFLRAAEDITLIVGEGELVTLIGSNGAGKSSILNAVAGLIKPADGKVTLAGEDITGRPAYKTVRAGLSLVPEGRMVAAPLTVMENLAQCRQKRRTTPEAFASRMEWVFELFPVLHARRGQLAGSLSGGEQQMLAVARAVLTEPRVLLLDEPSMGLAPAMVDTVVGALLQIHGEGQSMLLVEQNAELALEIADRGYILQRGSIVESGPPDALRASSDFALALMA